MRRGWGNKTKKRGGREGSKTGHTQKPQGKMEGTKTTATDKGQKRER